MLARFTDGDKTYWVNPAQVKYIRACWSSTRANPRADLMLAPDLSAFNILWFLFRRPYLTVDGDLETVARRINEALTQRANSDLASC